MGIDDPVGLPVVLTMEVERQNQIWNGQCVLEIAGTPIPVAPQTQHEAFRIAREAINNAIKHADATLIRVHLCYPLREEDRHVQLTIYDNGRKAEVVESHGDQRGVRYMRESARTAGGQLEICIEPRQSTTIIFSFPAAATSAG